MDFSFSEEQQEIQKLAAQILGDKVTHERLKEIEASPEWFDRDLWAELAKAASACQTLLVLRNRNVVAVLQNRCEQQGHIVVSDPLYRNGDAFFLPSIALERVWDGRALIVKPRSPVNRKAKVDNEKLRIAPIGDRAAKLVNIDWDTANEKRDEWTKRWNREVER